MSDEFMSEIMSFTCQTKKTRLIYQHCHPHPDIQQQQPNVLSMLLKVSSCIYRTILTIKFTGQI